MRIYPCRYDMKLLVSLATTNSVEYMIKPLHPAVMQDKLNRALSKIYESGKQ